MKSLILLLATSFAVVALTACSHPRDSWIMTPQALPKPPEPLLSVNQVNGLQQVDYTPKAEILFVVDNSDSMKAHIAEVSRNIDAFVNAFSKNNPLEFHAAVLSVYDRRTYESAAYQAKFGKIPHAYFLRGEFHPVKDAQGNVIPKKYFISSSDRDWQDMLKNTMKIGVQHLDEGGPQWEESFSPVAAVYNFLPPNNATGEKYLQETAQLNQERQGFFFGPNAYKIIFFITDASDDSPISPSQFYSDMLQTSNNDPSKIWAFGAIVPSSDLTCPRDPGNIPGHTNLIESFLRMTNQLPISADHRGRTAGLRETNFVSLCSSSFGEKFAEWGKLIREHTISQVIHLQYQPVVSSNPAQTLRVFYGNQEIPFADKPGVIGFTYSPSDNSIVLDPRLRLKTEPGAQLHVSYIPIPPSAIQNGHVKQYMAPQ